MAWRGPPTRRDELLGTYKWRVTIRKYWVAKRLPCSICRRAIDYRPNSRYLPGTRKLNPRALVVGHIVSRYAAKRMGWTEAMINSVSNTRPECVACSNRSGQQLGARVKNSQQQVRRTDDRDRW
jgi:hypothetical protein